MQYWKEVGIFAGGAAAGLAAEYGIKKAWPYAKPYLEKARAWLDEKRGSKQVVETKPEEDYIPEGPADTDGDHVPCGVPYQFVLTDEIEKDILTEENETAATELFEAKRIVNDEGYSFEEGIRQVQTRPLAASELVYFVEDEVLAEKDMEECENPSLLHAVIEAHIMQPGANRLYFFDGGTDEGFSVDVTHADYADAYNKMVDERLEKGDILYTEEE